MQINMEYIEVPSSDRLDAILRSELCDCARGEDVGVDSLSGVHRPTVAVRLEQRLDFDNGRLEFSRDLSDQNGLFADFERWEVISRV